jgi:hypothetical protein
MKNITFKVSNVHLHGPAFLLSKLAKAVLRR